ncbi:SDR family NAD(P)-dependent oxidoreductase [Chromobacterium alticapitis]|uniref:SDR family NAD(P)-dependent oxidoreductase n=1 Tax=Chromobacterium alticapitis TaxID=2073169 RepID=UPI001E50922D|nr:SDR family NAD(P)-dependent oxidoreductase [Chromobacterium alticapitis]
MGEHHVLICGGAIPAAELARHLNDAQCRALEGGFVAQAESLLAMLRQLMSLRPQHAALVQIVVPALGAEQLSTALQGMLLSARAENPRLLGQIISIEVDESPTELARKLRQDAAHPEQRRIRYLDGERWVAEWHALQEETAHRPWKDKGVYLITGGLGGLGRLFAREIAARAANAVLVLTGRRPLAESQLDGIRELEALGARVDYRQLDVADAAAIRRLLLEIQEEYESLDGILHAAGVVRPNFVLRKSAEELHEVMAAKVAGLVNLDEASGDIELDVFLCFSSISAVVGIEGEADYASANAFMDAYAAYRNSLVAHGKRHGRMLSMNWPMWLDGGMRLDDITEQAMARATGMIPMRSEDGFDALYRALASGHDQVAVMAGEPDLMRRALNGESARARPAAPAPQADAGSLRADVLARLSALFAQVAKCDPARLDPAEPFETYGIDSIMITQLNAALSETFGDMPKTLFYEFHTLSALTDYFVAEHADSCLRLTGTAEPAQAPAASTAPARRTDNALSPAPAPQTSAREPIAIIGLSARYPGADDAEAFWRRISGQQSCISEIPPERWPLDDFFLADPEAGAKGRSYGKWGGFINGFADFDPLFFGISPRDALNIDPQERLFLQASWEVLEDAGYTRESLASRHGGRVGVFAGITKPGYELYLADLAQPSAARPSTSFGSLANRVSYFLNLRGPSMPIDTMCSASATAIHEACEHLLRDECELAIAGGVNLYLHPSGYLQLSSMRMLSSDQHCRSFGAGGDGYVPGEGVGAVLLKPLSRAMADGDHIYGLIRGSAINHGGKTNGYTVPNPAAQSEVIALALKRAGVHPRAVSYVEAHGTGTALGDPIEVAGLNKAFSAAAPARRFCALGSVKSHIGHSESAAGIAGLTKVLLQMRHGQLAPTLNARTPNPNIDFDASPFLLQHELAEWPRPQIEIDGEMRQFPRIAGISSFGAGGANAHIVLEEFVDERPSRQSNGAVLIPLSARNRDRLQARMAQLLQTIADGRIHDGNLADAAYTLQIGREAMELRLAFSCRTVEEMAQCLRSALTDPAADSRLHLANAKRAKETLAGLDHAAAASWIAARDDDALLAAWAKGLDVDWHLLYGDTPPRRISLPAYPFARETLWLPQMGITPGQRRELAAAHRQDADGLGTLLFAPRWRDVEPAQAIAAQTEKRLLWLAHPAYDAEALQAALPAIDCRALPGDFEAQAAALLTDLQRLSASTSAPVLLQLIVPGDGGEQSSAALLGLLRGSQIETPGQRCQLIMLDAGETIEALARKLDRCAASADEQFRFLGNRLQTLGWQPLEPLEASPPWRADGVYLITGGLGGLGLLFARQIAEHASGAAIVLAGRRQADEADQTAMAALRARGARVAYHALDLADADQVSSLIQRLTREYGGLNGVLHAAGLGRDARLADKTAAQLHEVLAPKAAGLRNLAAATRDLPLDVFICFSSLAAVRGNAGQADYATANAFLDAFAELSFARQADKQRARILSIDWPLWRDGGMRIDADMAEMMTQATGLTPLSAAEGVRALYRALASGLPRVLVLSGELARLRAGFLDVAPPRPASGAAGGDDLREAICRQLIAHVSALLSLRETDIDPEDPYHQFGFDSVSLTTFGSQLNQRWGTRLAPTIFFAHPTLNALARHLCDTEAERFASLLTGGEARPAQTPSLAAPEDKPRAPGAPAGADAIAIIGMSGRFPQARDIDAFWRNLRDGVDCIAEIPPERWDWREYYGDPGREQDKTNIKWGGFIEGVDEFDPLFFGISPREAKLMDPQQRLLMQHVWWALEDAGQAPSSLAGSKTAIFVGTCTSGYSERVTQATIEGYTSTSLVPSIGPNRMSYLLDLHGPSEPVETACSSSLVAIHRAARGILGGESEMAIAGGVNTLLSPKGTISLNKAGMLCEDGRCKTFSADANGYVRSEGVGMLVLKRLSAAERDGDRIYGLIRGSAQNHGGRATSLTAPNPKAQAELIRTAWTHAGVDPRTIGYIEAHGTGTALGDPVEIDGLKLAFGETVGEAGLAQQEIGRCGIGSVKSNIGHLELAAGVAGVIKVLLQMRHRTLVKSLHCETLNPYIDLRDSPFHIVRENAEWTAPRDADGRELPRRAGVSSFGFGGVNAHVVLEEYVDRRQSDAPTEAESPALIVLSARDERRLRESAGQLLRAIRAGAVRQDNLADTAYTLQVGRDAMPCRLAVLASSSTELDRALRAFVNGEQAAGAPVFVSSPDAACAAPPDCAHAEALAQWLAGKTPDWTALHVGRRPLRVSLPGYPFARESHWIEPSLGAPASSPAARAAGSPLVRPAPSGADGIRRFLIGLDGAESFLRDHRVQGRRVLPGVAYLEMARAAYVSDQKLDDDFRLRMSHVEWAQPLIVESRCEAELALRAAANGGTAFSISRDGILHCQGSLQPLPAAPAPLRRLPEWRDRCQARRLEADECYRRFAAMGLQYGPAHQGIAALSVGEGCAIAHLRLPEAVEADARGYVLHPSLLDSALQAVAGLALDEAGALALPFSVERVDLFSRCQRDMWAVVEPSAGLASHGRIRKYDIDLCRADGEVCVRLQGFSSRTAGPTAPGSGRAAAKPHAGAAITQPQSEHLRASSKSAAPLHITRNTDMPEIRTQDLPLSHGAPYPSMLREMQRNLTPSRLAPLYQPPRDEDALLRSLQHMLPRLLAAQLQTMGLRAPFKPAQQLVEELRILPFYTRWLEESLRLLAGSFDGGALPAFDSQAAWREWDEHKRSWQASPTFSAQSTLLEAMLRALPDILRGQVPATSVMFPNSSMALVEGIYKHNPVSDYFNAVLIEMAVTFIDARLKQDPAARIRILEIGAGTGGTSAPLLKRLQAYRDRIEEYCYTDLSKAFLLHADKHYAPDSPYLRGRIFDVSRPLSEQGIEPHSYDLVVATNVLHATSDIRNSVRHARALLRENGLLLLNELSRNVPFAHLTFGLLEGWWLYEDAELRIPGCPGLSASSWHAVLKAEGFRGIMFPTEDHAELGQQIVVAENGAADEVERTSNVQPRVATPPADQHASSDLYPRALGYFQELIASAVQLPVGDIHPDAPFEQYGIDSILVVQLNNALRQTFDDVSSTLFFEHRTLAGLTRHFVQTQADALAQALGTVAPRQAPAAADTDVAVFTPPAADELYPRALRYFQELIASAVQLPVDDIHPDASFEQYGIDSILVVQLNNALRQTFDDVSSTLFFEHRTLAGLARHFVQTQPAELAKILGMQQTPPAPSFGSPASRTAEPPKALDRDAESDSDIAVIGLAGRYAMADDIGQFWRNLSQGRHCISEVPAERWNHQLFYDPDKNRPGKAYSKWGGFVSGVSQFDPLFFSISPREAEQIDPQERLFLQEAYVGIQDAGYTPAGLGAAGKVGVFVGVMNGNYANGANFWSIANRVSFTFDFHGPSMAVDTACSSSLTALHLAMESLRGGASDVAIAGGVNLIIDPVQYLRLSSMKMLSAGDKCRAFGADADGFVDGEGVGVVVLKPLNRALADGDHIYGVIKACALNHGGRTSAYPVPNPDAQAAVIAEAMRQAGVDPRTIGYLEAHGTGTSLGDPIEIAGLSKAFRKATPDRQFCALGSVKSNIGHCESAAGIAGLSKVLLQLRHGQLAPSLHAEASNPNINFEATPFALQRRLAPWPRPRIGGAEHPRRAGLSSFGAGGANAHVIIEEAPALVDEPAQPTRPALIVLSARHPERLRETAARLLAATRERGWTDAQLPNLAYTLQTGREAMDERLAFQADSMADLAAKLEAFLADRADAAGLYRGSARRERYQAQAATLPDIGAGRQEACAPLLADWVQGSSVDWSAWHGARPPRRMSLPGYPFAREHCWVAPERRLLAEPSAPEPGRDDQARPSMPPAGLLRPVWRADQPALAEPPAGQRLLAFGASDDQLRELRQRYPAIVPLSLEPRLASDDLDHAIQTVGAIDHIVWIAPTAKAESIDSDAHIQAQSEGVLACFRLVKALLAAGYESRPLQWTVLTAQALAAHPDEDIAPDHASVHGLIGSMIKEFPAWSARLADLPARADAPLADALRLPADRQGQSWLFRQGQWHRQEWLPLPGDTVGETAYRLGGVYVVIGGAGGIGEVWSEHMVRRYGAKLFWIGRRPEDDVIRGKIARLAALGPAPRYLVADATDRASLQAACDAIRREQPRIHGVVHSAIVLQDQSLTRMTESRFAASLAAKVDVSVRMAQVFGPESLDFALFFSSLQSVGRAPGQSNYAAGCTFKDAFAHQLGRAWPCPVKTMNWGWWGSVGVVTASDYHARMAKAGLASIEPGEAMAALDVLMGGSHGQLGLLKTTDMAAVEPSAPIPTLAPAAEPGARPHDPAALKQRGIDALKRLIGTQLHVREQDIDIMESLSAYGVDSISITQLSSALGQSFQQISNALFADYPTIAELADHLLATQPEAYARWAGVADVPQQITVAPAPRSNAMPVEPASHAEPVDAALPPAAGTDIAIIGLACQFPGANNLAEYWEMLLEGRQADHNGPASRWPQRETAAKARFLDGVKQFDPGFFGLSALQAQAMDPQERLFLLNCWHALEDAGYGDNKWLDEYNKGEDEIGVFVGVTSPTYHLVGFEQTLAGNPVPTGMSFASIANRVSHALHLCGPSLAIDTMCSSSLVALHSACDSLRQGNCAMAIAGGVNLYLHPSRLDTIAQAQLAAEDGIDRSFAAGGRGFLPAEGVAAVVLKPLSQAMRDGDDIYAVIKGGAIGHSGNTLNYFVPSARSQRKVIERALAQAGLQADQVAYVEMQANGDEVSDGIEFEAIRAGYQTEHRQTRALRVGSVKPNIGHPEAAAGMAQLIKTILQLKHRQWAPTLVHGEPHPALGFEASRLRPQLCRETFDAASPYCAIHAFGGGGMAAHIVLAPSPALPVTPNGTTTVLGRLLTLSAHNRDALKRGAARLAGYLAHLAEDAPLDNIAYTLQTGRSAFSHRLAILADSPSSARARLEAYSRGEHRAGVILSPETGAGKLDADADAAAALAAGGHLSALAQLWVSGMTVDWRACWRGTPSSSRRVHLPGYAFELREYWPDTRPAPSALSPAPAAPAARLGSESAMPDLSTEFGSRYQSVSDRLYLATLSQLLAWLQTQGITLSSQASTQAHFLSAASAGTPAARLLDLMEKQGFVQRDRQGRLSLPAGVQPEALEEQRDAQLSLLLRAMPEYQPYFALLPLGLARLEQNPADSAPAPMALLAQAIVAPSKFAFINRICAESSLKQRLLERRTISVLDIGAGSFDFLHAIAHSVPGDIRIRYCLVSDSPELATALVQQGQEHFPHVDFTHSSSETLALSRESGEIDVTIVRAHTPCCGRLLSLLARLGDWCSQDGVVLLSQAPESQGTGLLRALLAQEEAVQPPSFEQIAETIVDAGCRREDVFPNWLSIFLRDGSLLPPDDGDKADEQQTAILEAVRHAIAQALPADVRLDPEANLAQYGLSSFGLALACARLQQQFGEAAHVSALARDPDALSIACMAQRIRSRLEDGRDALAMPGAAMAPIAGQIAQRLEALTRGQAALSASETLRRGEFVSSRGQRIEYFEIGEGQPLIFLTALAFTKSIWENQIQTFSASHRLIFPHLPGHAGSAPCLDFTFDELADDLAELMNALEIRQAHLAGWCMAGNIAQTFALRHASRLSSLILVCTTPTDARMRGVTRFDVESYSASPLGAYEMEFQNIYREAFLSPEVSRHLAIIRQSHVELPPHAVLSYIGNLFRFDTRAQLRKIKLPTLIVAGHWDIAFPIDQVALLKDGIPHADFVEMQDGGHLPFLNNSEQFNAIVADFLTRSISLKHRRAVHR